MLDETQNKFTIIFYIDVADEFFAVLKKKIVYIVIM